MQCDDSHNRLAFMSNVTYSLTCVTDRYVEVNTSRCCYIEVLIKNAVVKSVLCILIKIR